MKMVAQCFEDLAGALNKHGALALSDSYSHHYWFFPPPDVLLSAATSPDAPPSAVTPPDTPPLNCSCNCGMTTLSALPVDTSWSIVGLGATMGTHPPLPTLHCQDQFGKDHTPSVFDLLTPRVGAISCANELSGVVFKTAFMLTS